MAQEQVDVPVAVDVAQCNAHSRLADSEPIVGRAEQHRVVLELAGAAVHPELVRVGVVGNVDVGQSVLVQVRGGDPQAGVFDQRDAGRPAALDETRPAPVPVEDIGLALELLRTAVVHPPALDLALPRLVPLDVAGDVEVEPAVEIRVEEHRRGRPAGRRHAERGRRVDEAAAALVPVEHVGAQIRDVQVEVAVVVDVADRGAHAVARVVEPRIRGRVRETAARALPVEAIATRLAGDLAARVREVEIEQAVAIGVERRHAAAHDRRHRVRPRRAGRVDEVEAGLAGHVDEPHAARGRRCRRRSGRRLRSALLRRATEDRDRGAHEYRKP